MHFLEISNIPQGMKERETAYTIVFCLSLNMRGMRERSPPLSKIVHPSHPFWAIAGFNKAKCNAESPPGGTACLITVSPVPGKLASPLTPWLIYPDLTETVVVLSLAFTLHNGIHT